MNKIKLHVDGSACNYIDKVPSRLVIAKYWISNSNHLIRKIYEDEPCCFRCGYHRHQAMLMENDLKRYNPTNWNHCTFLEKAHILPKALGGCDCPANLVLLCRKCHKENPDTKNIEQFMAWLNNGKSFIYDRFEEIIKAFKDFNIPCTYINLELYMSKQFIFYSSKKSVLVAGKITEASRMSLFKEWKDKYWCSELCDELNINKRKIHLFENIDIGLIYDTIFKAKILDNDKLRNAFIKDLENRLIINAKKYRIKINDNDKN